MLAQCGRHLIALLVTILLCYGAAAAEEPRQADPQQLLRDARKQFSRADRDEDVKLRLEEFLSVYPTEEHDHLKRQFAEYDRGADGALSRGEFAKFFLPTDQRGPLRDPIVELERRALAKWQAIFDVAAGGGAVTRENWPAEQIARRIPALADVTFEQWDRNGDGEVDRDEGRWLMEVAYGLTQLDGRPIRTSNGRVFSWYYFRAVDQNGDGVLSHREFLANHDGGANREKNAATFAKYDADADGRLTAEETLILYWHDTLAEFFSYDRNSDGSLSADEFLAIGWATEIARRSARVFDVDGDGKVSYHEFRGTTFANQASDWGKLRRDANGDGQLSFEEFYLEKPPLLVALSRYVFDRFDLDQNGSLSPEEFDFDGDFGRGDADLDGQLTLSEFLAVRPDADPADRRRRFLVFDFDGNGRLDAKEYRNFSAPVDERGNVPDPMAEFADAALAKWEAIVATADRDRDAALSLAEWPAKQIAAEIPALADVPFFLWDRASDGKVDLADARWLCDVAYGLAKPDGQPLRTPTGRMFAWYFFRRHDADHNGLMSRNEFVAGYHPANVNTAELFEKLDADGDGQLTHQETWSVFWHDTIGTFLDYDRNHDGYLTADEIFAIGWGRMLARRTVPVFDDDGDGKLSFREFRLTNFANQASDWWQLRDLDNDGRIAWPEFYREKPPLLIAQSRFYFDRYDRNKDGFLSPLEFASEADPTHGQILAYVNMLQQVLPLEVQFARHVGRLNDEQAAALEREGDTAIERLVEKSASTPRNNQAGVAGGGGAGLSAAAMPTMTGTGLAIMRSPHLLLRRELAQALRPPPEKSEDARGDSAVALDAWQTLDSERVRAEKRRKQAAIQVHVAMLDETLLLSGKQRQELCELLAGEASDGWWQPINGVVILNPQAEQLFAMLSSGGYYGLFVPEAELAKRLTSTQLTAFKDLQQPHELEVYYAQQGPARPAGAAAPVAPAGIANKAGAGQPRAGPAAPAARVLPAPGVGGMGGGMMGGQPNVRRRFLRQGPTIEVHERRLTTYVEQRLDDINRVCGLADALRAKLLLAAKLDLARLREKLASRPPDKLNDGEELVVQKVHVRWPAASPLGIFSGPESHFQKSLQGRLRDDQKKKLAAADAERRAFQRQALIEAVVAGFERSAALTSAQCDALATLLNDAIADVEADSPDDWRFECLRRMAQLPFERLQPLLLDFQQAGAKQQHAQLIESARQFEETRKQQAALGVPSA
jgi:Ca2+-binding EF-hand superfamily protein